MDAASSAAAADGEPAPMARAAAAALPAPSLRRAGRRLADFLRPRRAALVLGTLAFFGSAAMEPLLPVLFKVLLDRGFKTDAGFPAWLIPAAVVVVFVIRGALLFAGTYLFAWATSHAVQALRHDLVRAVMRADASLYAAISPGVAASRVINDPQNATQSILGSTTTLLREGTTLVALMSYLLYVNWRLTLVSLITAPAIALVVRRVQRRAVAIGGQSYESQVRLIGIVDDITRAWRVVRSFDAAPFEQRRFDAEAERLRRTTLKASTAAGMMTPLTQIVASLGVALILSLALAEAHRGAATVGEFVAFLTALLMTITPMRRLTDVTQPIVGGLIQARACFDLLDTPPEPDAGERDLEAGAVAGDVVFEQTAAHYPGADRAALHEVSMRLAPGTTTALVGASGAGKSTLVNALLGFVAPTAGRVLLDGIDIRSLRKAALRRQMAVVSQEIVLFDGSIDDNVVYAQPRDPERIDAALAAADLREFVRSLPAGGATPIGINGSRLSGGQRQRLAIARALYKEASIWIFDEATSSLDSESERAVQQSIERWRGRKTILLIAHRLSTVRHADCIHVLAEGRVVESGTHAALIARGGLYAAMVRAQSMQ